MALVLSTALLPWVGRLALLNTLVPLVVVVVFYRTSCRNLSKVGLAWSEAPPRLVAVGFALAILDYGLEAITVYPLSRFLFEQPKDLSLFEPMKGNRYYWP